MRTLASIQRVREIRPIEGADAIECAVINGWTVVAKKNEFHVDDLVIYCEIDSWIPTELAPFLSKGKSPREYEGVSGERLRTVRLRGQLSQGLILPLTIIPGYEEFGDVPHVELTDEHGVKSLVPLVEGFEVTEILGIQKWEAPIPAQLRGQIKGMFPSFLRKTDEERIQNLIKFFPQFIGTKFNLHEKLDGSSMTVYYRDGEFGVCSRNLDIAETEDNSFWQVANRYRLREKLACFRNYAIQGELVGPGVQKNRYNLKEIDVYVFNVFSIDSGEYLCANDAKALTEQLGMKFVPFVMDHEFTENDTVESLLALAEGPSVLNSSVEREGLVWRPYREQEIRNLGRLSFKTISNKFLEKGGD